MAKQSTSRRQRRAKQVPGGLAALELVLATAITMPILVFMLVLGIRASRVFFSVLGTMIGSPHM